MRVKSAWQARRQELDVWMHSARMYGRLVHSFAEDVRRQIFVVHANHFAEGIHQFAVPPATFGFFFHQVQRNFGSESHLIRPVGGQRIIHIRKLQDPRCDRNLLALQAIRITRTIVSFRDGGE